MKKKIIIIIIILVFFDDKNDSWSTSKEFLEKFNQKIIDNRER